MPTWPGAVMVPSAPGTNTRSPGRSWPRSATGVPAWNCSEAVRGRLTPAALYACWTREEQSHWWAGSPPWELVQSPSRWYGVPSWANAHMIAAVTAGGVSGGRLNLDGGATTVRYAGSGAAGRAPTRTVGGAWPRAGLCEVPTGGRPAGGGVGPPAGSEALGAGTAMQEALAAPPTRPASRPPQASRTPM